MSKPKEATAVAQKQPLTCLKLSKLESTKNILLFAIELYEEQFTNNLFKLAKDYDAWVDYSEKSYYKNRCLLGFQETLSAKQDRFYTFKIKRSLARDKKTDTLTVLQELHSLFMLNCTESLRAFKGTDFAKDYKDFKKEGKVVFKELIAFVVNAKTL